MERRQRASQSLLDRTQRVTNPARASERPLARGEQWGSQARRAIARPVGCFSCAFRSVNSAGIDK